MGISALLTAGIMKVIEQNILKTDVNFLFCVYCFVRGVKLIPADMTFETYVDLMITKQFKII